MHHDQVNDTTVSEIMSPLGQSLTILLVEDNPSDVKLIEYILNAQDRIKVDLLKADCVEAIKAFGSSDLDLILLDLTLPDSQGFQTCNKVQDICPGVPIVVLTGNDDDDLAIQLVKAGVQDYLVKGEFQPRWLVKTILHSIERYKLYNELKNAQQKINRLEGLLPICSYCKRIRDESDQWDTVENYVSERTDADFTHGVCPACFDKVMSQMNR